MAEIKQWLEDIFTKVKRSEFVHETDNINAPGTQINYDRALVRNLKADRQHLVAIFTKMITHANNKNLAKLQTAIADFLALFNSHALTEYTKLYIFLVHAYKNDPKNHQIIMKFRYEMQNIGKAVRIFCTDWTQPGLSTQDLSHFLEEANGIGAVLTQRIKVEEEQLYQIYDKAPNMLHENKRVHLETSY